jgi:glycosyltransferase involved in cell wall biosynthesis
MSKLAIITTHPIQYYAPVFQAIAKEHPDFKVFYTWGEDSVKKFDPDFRKTIEWDIPLLEGYDYQFLKNTSSNPGTSHFRGIVNPDAIQEIDRFKPDFILVYGWAWHSHLKIIRHYARKKKVWFRGDSTLLDATKGSKKIIRTFFLRWIYRHIDLAFYVGTQNKKYFQRFGLKEHQLKFAPHSIDNNRFSMDKKDEAARIREQIGIPATGIVLLFAGKLEPKKDPFTLLEAFEHLASENVFLLFAGNGVLEEELKARARRSVKKKAIFFLGFQNQSTMPALYQACQIFCLPSVGPGETWGLAVNEAMAARRPVVVSDKVGCAVDLVKEGINGYIFRNSDKEDLAHQLQNLIEKADQLEKFGAASQKIIENWSFENQVSLILEELNTVPCRK